MKTDALPAARSLLQKLWDRHVVDLDGEGIALLYMDRHLVYEVTSPQAFEGRREAGRRAWRPETVLATTDHNVPTRDRAAGVSDPLARAQVEQLSINCRKFSITELA